MNAIATARFTTLQTAARRTGQRTALRRAAMRAIVPSSGSKVLPATRFVHTFGHPSSGGPLVEPFETATLLGAYDFEFHAGHHARNLEAKHARAVRPAPANVYGEEFFGEVVPF
eukprot:m.170477 g.170477  ORF g.170477 m.170477 type:complete len:114 (+) comp9927_c2_seq2:1231-1572(+)